MSINPASVSEPVMRDTDSSSNHLKGSLLQGSRTGSKEGQFSSFWDNAVRGAQKLLGLEKTEQEVEPSDDDEPQEKKRVDGRREDVLNTVSGFGGNRFGMSLTMGRDPLGVLPRFGRIEQARSETSEEHSNALTRLSEQRERKPEPGPSEKANSRALERGAAKPDDNDSLEEDEGEAKSADQTKTPSPGKPQSHPSDFLNTNRQQVKNSSGGVGTENAKLLGNMPLVSQEKENLAPVQQSRPATVAPVSDGTTPVVDPASREAAATDVKTVQNPLVSSAKALTTPEAPQQQKPIAAAPAKQSAETSVLSEQAAKPTQEAAKTVAKPEPVANPQIAGNTAKGDTSQASTVSSKPASPEAAQSDTKATKSNFEGELDLGFEPEKVKAEVSAALQRQAKATQARTSQATVQQPSQAKSESSGDGVSKSPEATRTENSETLKTAEPKPTNPEALNRMAPVARQRRADVPANTEQARPQNTPNANSNAVDNANANSRVANPEKNDFQVQANRDIPRANLPANAQRSRPVSTPAGQTNGQGLGLAGGISGVPGAGQTAGSQSPANQQGFEQAPKQSEVAIAAKTASASVRADKGGESTQSFDVQSTSGSQTRRAQAAAKSQPSSYVSKTVEEVKEVIATLTKSIDRLSATRQDTISVRVSFDQGGSLSLKVSMDNGQVNASMQTDVPGLEGMLKGAWNELVNEVAQKGIKLNQPQFAQSDSDSKNETFASNEQRDGRSQSSEANADRGRNGRRAPGSNGQGSSATANSSDSNDEELDTSGSVVSKNELKTYA